ncbi:MAG: hypothetical protein E7259_04325 [Lachnospiraceae bacterium]|nr:hypothetical protein [Lachnospiraceae bacterium]
MFAALKKKYDEMSQVAKAALWFTICGFLQRGISVLTTPIFTRLLDTAEYGQYNVFSSWMEIVTILATLRLGYGVYVQGLVKYSDDQEKYSSSLLSLTFVWWGSFLAIYLIFRDFWNKILGLSTFVVVCMFVMVLTTATFTFWAAKQRNDFKYKSLVALTIIVSLVKPVLGIFLVVNTENYKTEARIFAQTLVELVIYSALFVLILAKGRTFFHKGYWKYALAFNLPLVPHYLAQVVLNHSDKIMIQKMVGLSEAGVYGLSYNIAMIMTILNTSILNTLRPWIFQKIKAKEETKIQPVGMGALFLVAIFNLCLIIFTPEVVTIFAPSSYKDAVDLMVPITMSVFFVFIYNMLVDIELYYEKTKITMVVSIICAIVNIALNYVCIPKFGYVVAGYTTLFSYFLMACIHYLANKIILKKYSKNRPIYKLGPILIISVVFVLCGTGICFIYDNLIARIAVFIAFSLVLWCNKNRIFVILKPSYRDK